MMPTLPLTTDKLLTGCCWPPSASAGMTEADECFHETVAEFRTTPADELRLGFFRRFRLHDEPVGSLTGKSE